MSLYDKSKGLALIRSTRGDVYVVVMFKLSLWLKMLQLMSDKLLSDELMFDKLLSDQLMFE